MGKASENEKLKLRATFLNNVATAFLITGFIVPYLAWLTAFMDRSMQLRQIAGQSWTWERWWHPFSLIYHTIDKPKALVLAASQYYQCSPLLRLIGWLFGL